MNNEIHKLNILDDNFIMNNKELIDVFNLLIKK